MNACGINCIYFKKLRICGFYKLNVHFLIHHLGTLKDTSTDILHILQDR